MDPATTVGLAEQISTSAAAALVILMLVSVALGWACRALYRDKNAASEAHNAAAMEQASKYAEHLAGSLAVLESLRDGNRELKQELSDLRNVIRDIKQ